MGELSMGELSVRRRYIEREEQSEVYRARGAVRGIQSYMSSIRHVQANMHVLHLPCHCSAHHLLQFPTTSTKNRKSAKKMYRRRRDRPLLSALKIYGCYFDYGLHRLHKSSSTWCCRQGQSVSCKYISKHSLKMRYIYIYTCIQIFYKKIKQKIFSALRTNCIVQMTSAQRKEVLLVPESINLL